MRAAYLYPGIAKLVSRLVWDQETVRSSRTTRTNAAENGTKSPLTTGMTTDRKSFVFTVRRGIMAEIEYPGVAQLVGRDIWDVEVGCSSHLTRTKIPLKLLISEGFFLFFVYCGTDVELVILNISFRQAQT